MSVCRLISLADAPVLASLLRANREFLAPWEPIRGEDYFSAGGQRKDIEGVLARHAAGTALPYVITSNGHVAGKITLSGIVRGPFLSCSVGYWVAQSQGGQGLATAAVREIVGVAFGELGLHRIQAETLLENPASQRVLTRNGFTRIGMAPRYLKIAGRWQDCILYQVLNEAIE